MSSREQFAELITSILSLRAKPAETEFDAAMERASAAGVLDAITSREIRWWHRASQDELEQYVAEVLPQVLAAIDAGATRAAEAAAQDRAAWNQASAISTTTATAQSGEDATETLAADSPAATGAPIRRRLVAGLTVLSEGQPNEGNAMRQRLGNGGTGVE